MKTKDLGESFARLHRFAIECAESIAGESHITKDHLCEPIEDVARQFEKYQSYLQRCNDALKSAAIAGNDEDVQRLTDKQQHARDCAEDIAQSLVNLCVTMVQNEAATTRQRSESVIRAHKEATPEKPTLDITKGAGVRDVTARIEASTRQHELSQTFAALMSTARTYLSNMFDTGSLTHQRFDETLSNAEDAFHRLEQKANTILEHEDVPERLTDDLFEQQQALISQLGHVITDMTRLDEPREDTTTETLEALTELATTIDLYRKA